MILPWGMFGENFTTVGLAEDDLHVGDRFQIGSSIVMVRQPRTPCYKLAAKFQRDDMIERFLLSGRSGFYFSVETGRLGRGRRCLRVAEAGAGRHHDRRNESPLCAREIQSGSASQSHSQRRLCRKTGANIWRSDCGRSCRSQPSHDLHIASKDPSCRTIRPDPMIA